jgi:hypothetical protein
LAGQLEISASDFGVDRITLSTPAAELSRIASECPSGRNIHPGRLRIPRRHTA